MGPAPAPENPGSSKQNFPSCPPSPLGGRRPLPPEQEPEDKDDMVRLQISGNYDTIRSIRSMASIQTLEENADAPHTPQHRHSHDTISWLDFESKKSNHNHLGEKLGHSMHQSCERFSWKDSAMSFFPLFERMKKLNYSVKDDLVTDIIAGLTIAILHIPQGIAYSFLIGISPVYGLYTSFFPVLIYAFMGSAQHISIGKHRASFFAKTSYRRRSSFSRTLRSSRASISRNDRRRRYNARRDRKEVHRQLRGLRRDAGPRLQSAQRHDDHIRLDCQLHRNYEQRSERDHHNGRTSRTQSSSALHAN